GRGSFDRDAGDLCALLVVLRQPRDGRLRPGTRHTGPRRQPDEVRARALSRRNRRCAGYLDNGDDISAHPGSSTAERTDTDQRLARVRVAAGLPARLLRLYAEWAQLCVE